MASPARRTIPLPALWNLRLDRITPVLLVSTAESDMGVLSEGLRGSHYVLIQARDWGSVLKLTRQMVFPVILYDREFDGGKWTSAVKELTRAWPGSLILLLAPADNVDATEHSILPRPFNDVRQRLDAELISSKRRS